MNKLRFALQSLSIVILLLVAASAAQAQATRTWVSGVGDDANPCSRTAPCKTFAGAISKTAAGGEISVLDPGGYGAVTITKSITIDGGTGAGWGSILASGTNGVIVNDSLTATPNTIVVRLRNLSINGSGTTLGTNGIRFLSGKALHVENVTIFNFSTTGIDFRPAAAASDLYVTDTSVRNCGGTTGAGIFLQSTAGISGATLTRVQLERNAFGIDARDNMRASVTSSVISGQTVTGVRTTTAGGAVQINLVNSMVSHNSTAGVDAGASTTVRLLGSHIINNSTGLQGAGTIVSSGDNVVTGNGTNGAPNSVIGKV